MTQKSKIFSLFSIPVYLTRLNKNLSKKELSFINFIKNDVYKNEGNITTNDGYVLEREVFKNLKNELNLIVQDYFNTVINATNDVVPYITQSWLNYTEKDQFHHRHSHPNSLVSGVVYLAANKKFDKINFFKRNTYQVIKSL